MHVEARSRAPIRAAAAGRDCRRRNAGCTLRDTRSDGARQRGPSIRGNAHAIAECVRRLRPHLDVRVAFCEQNFPNLGDVLPTLSHGAVVVPLLLADAYHARVDIPAMIAEAGVDVRRADVLGEDDRLIHVLRQRLEQAGVSRLDPEIGVLVTAVGSSRPDANARTETVARELTLTTRWTATTAFATGPHPSLAEAAQLFGAAVPTALSSHPGSSPTARSSIASPNSQRRNGFRWHRHLAPIVRWRKPCSTASTPSSRPAQRRRNSGSSTVQICTPDAAFCVRNCILGAIVV